MNGAPPALAELQHWLFAAITASSEPAGEELEKLIPPSRQQSPAERLAVYRHAFQARLICVLRELFPCTRDAVGEALFDQFCAGYLQTHPPTSYTLGRLADSFPEYLEGTRPRDWGEFIVDLARLEQAIDRVFDAAGPESLPPFVLPTHIEGDARLALAPGCELFSFRYPVSTYYTAWKAGQAGGWPGATAQHMALLRRDYIVRRFELTATQFQILFSLRAGSTLAEALVTAANLPDVSLDALAGSIERWFRIWAEERFFVAAD